MDVRLRNAVRERARFRCEYCHLCESHARFAPFQVEHIIPHQHRGKTILSNLAWACLRCNLQKGPNIAGIDDVTGKMAKLFHPRKMSWGRHFRRVGPVLRGRTPVGRVTVELLQMNDGHRVQVRISLLNEGIDPDDPVVP